MKRKNNGLILTILLVGIMMLPACKQYASTPPVVTPTLIAGGPFVSPFPSADNPMALIEEFAKGTATAAALTSVAGGGATAGTPGVPNAVGGDGTPSTPQGVTETITSTPEPATPTNADATAAIVVSAAPTLGGPTLTPLPPGVRPATYTLQKEEFPYCIARRFNVDPNELLKANNLSGGDVYFPGLALKIPQSGTWPGDRSWHDHPASHTVGATSPDVTLYGVACWYGDIDPAVIAQANGLSASSALTAGQKLNIP